MGNGELEPEKEKGEGNPGSCENRPRGELREGTKACRLPLAV